MRSLLCMLLVVGFTLTAETCSASITIDNPSTSWLSYEGPTDIVGDLLKTGTGPVAFKYDVAISGNTTIDAGILEFRGGVADLHSLSGGNTTTVNVLGNAVLNCTSIDCGTLNIGGIDNYTEPVPEPVLVPEPATVIIWSLLAGFGLLYGYRKQKVA